MLILLNSNSAVAISVTCFLKIIYLFLFLTALGLHGCTEAFSSEWALFFFCGAGASYCGGFSCFRAQALGAPASVVAARRLSCSVACGIFLDRNPTCVPCVGRQVHIHCATREVPVTCFPVEFFYPSTLR